MLSKFRRQSDANAMGASPTKSESARPHHLLELHDGKAPILCSAISADCSLLVTGDEKGILRIFSALSNPVECLAELTGHKGPITCCVIHECHILSGSADATIIKWSVSNATMVYAFRGHTMKINKILCVGKFLVSSSYDRTVKAWHLDADEQVPDVPEEKVVVSNAGKNQANKQNVTQEEESALQSDKNDSLVRTFTGHHKSVYSIAFIPADNNWQLSRRVCDRDLIVSGSADGEARIWSFSRGDCLKVLRGHSAPIHCIAVDPNNVMQVFTAGGDGKIIAWNTVTGERMRNLSGHEGTVLYMMTSNKMLYTSATDKTARAWVMEFGEETRVFKGSHSAVTCVQFFGGMLCTASEDGSSRIHDAKSGTLKRTFNGHQASITSLQNVHGKLFTTSLDGKLCIWDTHGFTDETVFGKKIVEEEEVSDDDCDKVKKAVKMLETYIRD